MLYQDVLAGLLNTVLIGLELRGSNWVALEIMQECYLGQEFSKALIGDNMALCWTFEGCHTYWKI